MITTTQTPPSPPSSPSAPSVRCRRFLVHGTQPGEELLDVGCGDGDLMRELSEIGCRVRGIEVDPARVEECRTRGFDVVSGVAEELPFEDESFDGIVCSVVLPYTDERRAMAEFARVLKPGGFANVTSHGIGYALEYLRSGPGWRMRFYAVRMMLNTLCYAATGRRLPGFLGDTLCELPGRMCSYAGANGLVLDREEIIETRGGHPCFLAQRFVKP